MTCFGGLMALVLTTIVFAAQMFPAKRFAALIFAIQLFAAQVLAPQMFAHLCLPHKCVCPITICLTSDEFSHDVGIGESLTIKYTPLSYHSHTKFYQEYYVTYCVKTHLCLKNTATFREVRTLRPKKCFPQKCMPHIFCSNVC